MATKRKVSLPEAPAQQSRQAAPQVEAQGTTTLDVDALRQIVEILEASDITRLSWRKGRERLLIRRGQPPAPVFHTAGPQVSVTHPVEYAPPAPLAKPAPAAAALAAATPGVAAAPEKPGHVVTSPFVGTFYRTPAPDQPAFVDVGTVVKKGQVLCIVEAMKLMNEIEADVAGKIAEIMAQNGQPVEFGQVLFRIEPA